MLQYRHIVMGMPNSPIARMANYLTFEPLEDDFKVGLSRSDCEYCIDGSGEWIKLPKGTYTPPINVGQIISFKGNLTPVSDFGIGQFSFFKRCNLKGNIMSLAYGDEAKEKTNARNWQFYRLFRNCPVVSVDSHFLPATLLGAYCYMELFRECTSLIQAPMLPATIIGNSAYSNMFYSCTSLETAPVLPMPTSMGLGCYGGMFQYCKKLSYIKALFQYPNNTTFITNWVLGVASDGIFVKAKGAEFPIGDNGIPEGWTVEEVAV